MAAKKVTKKKKKVAKVKPVRRVTSKRGRPVVGAGNGKPRLTAKKRAEQEEAARLAEAASSAAGPELAYESPEPTGYFGGIDLGDEDGN